MTEQHPIIPPPELTAEFWREASAGRENYPIGEIFSHGVQLAYAAGADMELEACLGQLRVWGMQGVKDLRTARRPKPPSLKQQALEAMGVPAKIGEARVIEYHEYELIRHALEALPND